MDMKLLPVGIGIFKELIDNYYYYYVEKQILLLKR